MICLLSVFLQAQAQGPMRCVVLPGGSSAPVTKEATCSTCPPPRTCNEIQNIRVNVHFLQHDDGSGNFGEFDDGRPGTPGTTTGYDYAQSLMWAMNGQMDQNPVLSLAPGSSLTPMPKRVRWVLDGVYFDRNSTYRNSAGTNNSPFQNHESLCVRADSVINIFLAEEYAWPYSSSGQPVTGTVTNRGYVFSSNQANCNSYAAPVKLWVVVASPWTGYVLSNNQPWQIASTVNHELCHLLGLNHPFESDAYSWGECADAPIHPDFPAIRQCWNLNEPAGPYCNAQSKVSNNLMDYNASQGGLSPCQVGIIQDNLNNCLRSRYVYKCSNCLPPTATFEVAVAAGCMPVPIWLDSRAAVNYSRYKLEIDRLNANGGLVMGTHYESTVNQQTLGRI